MRLRRASSFSTEARGRYGRYFLAIGLFVALLIATLIYALASMTIRF
jgi:hypothetical protein